MKTLTALALAALFCAPCHAATSRAQANEWLDKFETAKANSSDALILNNPAKRRDLMQKVVALRDRAEKLFGESSECASAANGLVNMYQDEVELVQGARNAHITASGLANSAWTAGEYFDICENKINSIK